MGLHFLAFWPCGPSFPCILAFSGSASGPLPTSCQNDGMRSVQGPGGFNVLFYDGMRSVQGPGGFNVLFYFCYDVSHSATEVKKPKKVFHYVMGSFGWVGCFQSNFNTWWGAILQTPMNPKLREARGRRQAGPTAAVSLLTQHGGTEASHCTAEVPGRFKPARASGHARCKRQLALE